MKIIFIFYNVVLFFYFILFLIIGQNDSNDCLIVISIWVHYYFSELPKTFTFYILFTVLSLYLLIFQVCHCIYQYPIFRTKYIYNPSVYLFANYSVQFVLLNNMFIDVSLEHGHCACALSKLIGVIFYLTNSLHHSFMFFFLNKCMRFNFFIS
jgi:hypothetical protein